MSELMPMTPEAAAGALRQRDGLRLSHTMIAWLEFDPQTACTGLHAIGRDGQPRRLGEPEDNWRSPLNSYGGGALCLQDNQAVMVQAGSGRLVQLCCDTGRRRTLTAEGEGHYGGLVAHPDGQRVLAVRSLHKAGLESQQLVQIDLQAPDCPVQVLAAGEDFYSAPAISDDGHCLAWVSWRLPDMPWVTSTLHSLDLRRAPAERAVTHHPLPAAGSVQQPLFSGNQLCVLSDHQGWWQPYDVSAGWERLCAVPADHANAPWQLGERHAAYLPGQGWVRVRYEEGEGQLWWQPDSGASEVRLAPQYTDFRALAQRHGRLYAVARSAVSLDAIVRIPLQGPVTVLAGAERPLPEQAISPPTLFAFTAADQATRVTGFYYPPLSAPVTPPPLLMLVHGGPTSAAYPVFDPQVQFWAHQGFAVALVNYRGSSGFGRAFRHALAGNWGLADVADLQSAAAHLAELGQADAGRILVQGRSAGGYTALLALVGETGFCAGASVFGVSDPWPLRAQTHRFESGYLDWLLGPPGKDGENWRQRSPLELSDSIRRPVSFFQGGRDPVVVPAQTETMVASLRACGQSPEYHCFPEEGHGFRQHRNQVTMLSALLGFYQRVTAIADR